jgi:hypothetical protein
MRSDSEENVNIAKNPTLQVEYEQVIPLSSEPEKSPDSDRAKNANPFETDKPDFGVRSNQLAASKPVSSMRSSRIDFQNISLTRAIRNFESRKEEEEEEGISSKARGDET